LKFLRDGIPSGNIFANAVGHSGTNFFSADLLSHTGTDTPPTGVVAAIGKKFSSVSDFTTSLGLSDFAQYGVEGNKYTGSHFNFPFRIRLVPGEGISKTSSEYFTD